MTGVLQQEQRIGEWGASAAGRGLLTSSGRSTLLSRFACSISDSCCVTVCLIQGAQQARRYKWSRCVLLPLVPLKLRGSHRLLHGGLCAQMLQNGLVELRRGHSRSDDVNKNWQWCVYWLQ